MHYYGGKSRNGKKIAAIIEQYRKPGQHYIEPFCGSLSVTQHVTGDRTASDINGYLISTYKAAQTGWTPPSTVSREEYHRYRQTQDMNDPMTGFVGIGISFGGAWFNGYAECYGSNGRSARSLVNKMRTCKDVTFLHREYHRYDPKGAVIYCDPPYANTNGYHFANEFDHAKFWETMRMWSKTNTVLVSEYNAPEDFRCIAEFSTIAQMNQNKHQPRLDKLWTLNEPHLFEWPVNTQPYK